MNAIEQFYLKQEEPNRSVFLALRDCILSIDTNLTSEWKYSLPFFYYKGKMFCYLWKDKKTNEPYIGIVKGSYLDHPLLEQGNRSRMKIFRVNPTADLPLAPLTDILKEALLLY